jgi:hypothetical protein
MADTHTLSAPLHHFCLNGHERKYVDVTLPFSLYRKFFEVRPFEAKTGVGHQRGFDPKHAARLGAEMLSGGYTPTQFAACLKPKQRKELARVEGGTVTLTLRETDRIPVTDAQHRGGAKEALLKRDATTAAEVLALPVGVRIFLDGDAKTDFLNHQKGKPVDKAHLFSLQTMSPDAPAEHKFALGVADLLLSSPDSPFHNAIRLDSKATQGLPVSTLCAKGVTDQSTSLVGLAKLAMAAGRKTEWAAGVVCLTHARLKDLAPELLEPGRVLTPPPHATRGSATMLIGVSVAVAFWLNEKGEDLPGDDLAERVVSACRQAGFDREVNGTLSAQGKRSLMNEFCSYLFEDWDGRREGVPEGLIGTLSAAAYGVKARAN